MTLWLAFEIALTAAFLSTEGRGGWGNWAIGINVHNEVLDGNIHFMLTSTRRVSTLLKVLQNYQSYDLGHHFWGLKCRAGLTRLNFCYIYQIICQNNHQNTVFVSGALYDELIIRNTQIFEKMRGKVHVLTIVKIIKILGQ